MFQDFAIIKNRCKRAFTLIELLVVVSIISLLVSILIPSLSKARDIARQVSCLSNIRSVSLGLQLYLDDNNRTLPLYSVSGALQTGWNIRLSEYVGGAENQDGLDVFHCPADQRKSSWPTSCPELPTQAMNAYMNEAWGYTKFDNTKTPDKKVLVSEAISNMNLTSPVRIINPSTGSYYSSHTLANLHGQSGYTSEAASYYGGGDSNNVLFADMHLELKKIDDMPDMTEQPALWCPWVE